MKCSRKAAPGPPMPEEFRVERHDDDRVRHERAEFPELLPARSEEVIRVRFRRRLSPRAIVESLWLVASGRCGDISNR